MQNKASKAQAVALIRAAMAKGFARRIEILRSGPQYPIFAVQVYLLYKNESKPWEPWLQIYVTFRQKSSHRRSSVSIRSNRIYTNGQKAAVPGLWDAQYLVNSVNS